MVANYQTGLKYTSASMTWVVPTVRYGASTDTTSSTEYSANWVGIGGFCANRLCTRGDHTLIQLGTEQDVSRSCPKGWCKSGGVFALSGGFCRFHQAATAGSLKIGSSLNGAIVSRVM